jgi:hypothetical protein
MIRTISHLAVMTDLSDRLVMIDPNDIEYPPALNLFDFGLDRLINYSPLEREKLLNGAIDLYEYLFGALLGAELTQKQGVIFRYLARLMMVVPGATIHTLVEFMENPETARKYIGKLDKVSRYFFETQFFASKFDNTREQILTRLWGVLSNPVLERMFGNKHNKLNLFEAMNNGSIITIHFDFSNRYAPEVRVKHSGNKVKKDRKLKLPPEIVPVFGEYVERYNITDIVFPYTPRFIEMLLSDVAKKAGVRKKVTAGVLRDTCAVRQLKRGEGIEKVLERLGLSEGTWEDAKDKYEKLGRGGI